MREMFYASGGRCAYSGLPLALGQTACLDHVLAVSRGGKVDDLTNLQWVHRDVNQAKWNLTDAEFLALVEAIYNHRIRPPKGTLS